MKNNSKRSFLVGGAGALCTALASPVWALEKELRPPAISNKYDVVVIGAGVSGLIAARELGNSGHKVLVLEADSQLGGKINVDGWIHPRQSYVARELRTYNLALNVTKCRGDDISLRNGIKKLIEETSSVCWQSSKLGCRSLNHFSSLNSEELDAFRKFSGVLEEIYGEPFNLKCLSKLMSLVNGDIGELATIVNTYHLENGILDLENRILLSSKADVIFNSQVSGVINAGDAFQIVTSDKNVFVRGVVVAIPSKVSDRIYFDPSIDSNAAQNGITWAGTGKARGWTGFIDGAIESGFKASYELHDYL